MKHRGDRHQQNQSHQPPSATEYLAEGVPPDDAEPIDARSSAPRTVAVTAYADGEHEPPALTPVPAPPWVSSALPNDMLALVCCYLGPCELGRLACVARRFTEGDDGGAQQLSPIEEGARLRLQLMVTRGGGSATQNGEATWLLALRSVECPVVFASCGPEVVLSDDGTVAVKDGSGHQSVVCSRHPMATGTHFAELTLLKDGQRKNWDHMGVHLGVVGAGFNAEGTGGGNQAGDSAEGWMLTTRLGELLHAGRCSKWEGQPQQHDDALKEGDVVGLLLDLEQRTLSVYLHGSRRGVMVAPGMRNWRGDSVADLAGPLRWAVDMSDGASVRIAHKPPPPPPTEAEVAAAVAWHQDAVATRLAFASSQ